MSSIAQTTDTKPAPTKKVVKKKTVKKSTGKKAIPALETDDGEDEGTPDIKVDIAIDYKCELGNKLTIYRNAADPKHIALRWGNTLHRLTTVSTTTGASRYENHKYGLVWIGIPTKGMLLDSKKGQQLANECMSSEQSPVPAPAPTGNLAEPARS
ncbi:MliC family protein [Glaciimonas immobilis]|nr:MliC family protein [Glaciimonas immobilis]